MQQLVRKFRNSAFLRHNAVYFFGMLAFGALNYLYYPVLGRLLPADKFGELQVLTSLFLQLLIFLMVLGLLTVNIVANYDDAWQRNRTISELEKLALFVGIALLLLTTLAGPMLTHFFHVDSRWPFVLLALVVLVTIPFTFRNAYLRGQKLFGMSSVANIVASAAQLIFSAALVSLGLGVSGAMFGLSLGLLAGFWFAASRAKRHGFHERQRSTFWKPPDLRLIRSELGYGGAVLLGSLAVTTLYSVDTIVAKHWFSPRTAGLYAGIATVARIIFFVTASIAQVLLPSVKLQESRTHENRQLLGKSLLLLMGIGGGILLAFTLFPRFVVSLLMGVTFLPLAGLLPRLGLVIFLISIINLFTLYFLALRQTKIVLIVILGVLGTFGWMWFHHGVPAAIVDSLLFGSILTLGLMGLWVSAVKFNSNLRA